MRVAGYEIKEEILQAALDEVLTHANGFTSIHLVGAIGRRIKGAPLVAGGWGVQWEAANRLVQRERKAGRLKFQGRRWHRITPEERS